MHQLAMDQALIILYNYTAESAWFSANQSCGYWETSGLNQWPLADLNGILDKYFSS